MSSAPRAELKNHFIKSPPRIVLYDPVADKNLKTYVFLGNVPDEIVAACRAEHRTPQQNSALKRFYGANYEQILGLENAPPHDKKRRVGAQDVDAQVVDIQDIDAHRIGLDIGELLRRPSTKRADDRAINFVTDIHIYPEDKISELRDKIFLATGVPIYRQHLFWFNEGVSTPQLTYTMSSDFSLLVTDIRDLRDAVVNKTSSIAGIPIDKTFYNNRESFRVDIDDIFVVANEVFANSPPTLYCVDLNDFVKTQRAHLEEISRDSYQFEMLYYGFIFKYWPQLTKECAKEYLINEEEMGFKFPELVRNPVALETVYRYEKEILDRKYELVEAGTIAQNTLPLAIVRLHAVLSTGVRINARHLFNWFVTSNDNPEISAVVEHRGSTYLLTKKHISHRQILAETPARNSVTIAIRDNTSWIFLNIANGQCEIRAEWPEELGFTFDSITPHIMSRVNPVIEKINALRRPIFAGGIGRIALISRGNLEYRGMDVNIYWKQTLLESDFRALKAAWEPYFRGRFIAPRNQQTDRYEFIYSKGIYQFDSETINKVISAIGATIQNQYAYLSNSTVKQKWEQNYEGRSARMFHRSADVRFEISDVFADEFWSFYTLICYFVYSAEEMLAKKKEESPAHDDKSGKRLRKLRELDPELYNLKKYNSDKVYSISCQKRFQPLIFTPEEVAAMTPQQKQALVQYHNFTLNQPAFYECPDAHYPFLSFIVGKHPKGYCLPCCKKKAASDDPENKRAHITSVCMEKFHFTADDARKFEMGGGVSRHIMAYGKSVGARRIAHLPEELRAILNVAGGSIGAFKRNKGAALDEALYVIGVDDAGNARDNFLAAMAMATGVSVEKMRKTLLNTVTPIMFGGLLNGDLANHFGELEKFIAAGQSDEAAAFSDFDNWPGVFLEILALSNVNVFHIVDTGTSIQLRIGDAQMKLIAPDSASSSIEHIILLEIEGDPARFYPIGTVNMDEFFKSDAKLGQGSKAVFTPDAPAVTHLMDLVQAEMRARQQYDLPLDLVFFEALSAETRDCKIIKKYINRRNLCYALEIEYAKKHLTIPISPSSYHAAKNSADKHRPEIIFSAPPHPQQKYEDVMEFIDKINQYIAAKYTVGGSSNTFLYKPLELEYFFAKDGVILGGVINSQYFYFRGAPRDGAKYQIKSLNYDILEVTNAILENRPAPSIKVGRALYKNYFYQLFVIEFLDFVMAEKNAEIRARLGAILKSLTPKNFQRVGETIERLLADYPEDAQRWRGELNNFYRGLTSREALLEILRATNFSFDLVTLNKIRENNSVEYNRKIITQIAKKITIRGDVGDEIDFPNVCTSCSVADNDYCRHGKLISPDAATLEKFIDILAHDLNDPLKTQNLFDAVERGSIINYFDFDAQSTEKIAISLL